MIRHPIMFSSFRYMILMLWFGKISFSFHNFHIIKVHPPNVAILDSWNNLHFFCDLARQLCSSHWETWYWCFGFAKKVFPCIISLIIKVHTSIRQTWILIIIIILFVITHHNYVLPISIHDINAFVWQEKLFISHFP